MSDLVVANKSDLVAIADAIRTKAGGSESLSFPNGFVDAIGGISTGGSSSGGAWLPVMNDGALMGEEITVSTGTMYTQGFTESDNGQYLVTVDGVVYLGSDGSNGISVDWNDVGSMGQIIITFTNKGYLKVKTASNTVRTLTLKLERWSEDGT